MGLAVLSLPIALVAFVVALARRHLVTVGVNEHAEVVRIARHARAWRVGGLLAGLVAAALALTVGQSVDALGRLVALAPALLGIGVLLGTIVGELTARPRVGVRRTAVVETRTVRGILPPVRTALVGVAGVLLAGALALGAAWGGPDDLQRAGRSFTQRCRVMVDGALVSAWSSRGPWPGSFYAVPLAAALGVAALLVLAALVAVTRRPRPQPESLGLDSMLRRWSAGTILTAALFTVLGTLGPVAVLIAAGLQPGECPMSVTQAVVRWVALAVGPVALVAGAAALGALLVTPTIRVDDLPRPLPGEATPVGAPVR
ncbi:hypothetical protein [Nostocoides sp. Soil756]|jgi:hypothetical protein|uniref:hypothetical protein n=1 Tax=Nostocoides sp. Soil756 TaxID=1736399 RepID=UPI0006FF7109|nr:hypothetical protein [Tetrasphaera sp. Soil756]KRE63433.1 hypothetical protein ASG78_00515 [Tetrasphaera sp. Soil756]